MATQNRSLEKATKNRGKPFWALSEERVNCEGSPTRRLTLDSPRAQGWVLVKAASEKKGPLESEVSFDADFCYCAAKP